MMEHYDIFISYKRKSLPTANNLYYRLTTRGYSTFFDLEEMRRDNFNVQLLNYIENAKDVFVILEEGSLDGCNKEKWEEEDWFCREIAFALAKKKNIIPILLGDYKMPDEDFFPDKLKELSLKHSPEFSFSYFDAYLDKLIEKKFITSEAHAQYKSTSVFKFYSDENCNVFKEGRMVCSLEGMSDVPYYLPVPRKGEYRFKAVNNATGEFRIMNKAIGDVEEKNVEIKWGKKVPALFRGNYKGCFGVIIVAVIAVIVAFFLLLGLKKSLQYRNILEASRSSSGLTIEDNEQKNESPVLNGFSIEESDENSDDEIINEYHESVDDYFSRQNSTKLDQRQGGDNVVSLTSGEVVDLGLSVNWASCNVGASFPEEAGGYYAWGETKEKDEYTEESYNYKETRYGHVYTKSIGHDISGTKYDVARSMLGGNYRMPTREEMKELILGCDWRYEEINGISGMVVTGKNGNCIFIPAVGSKENLSTRISSYYWTSTAGEYGTPYSLKIHRSNYDLINFISVEHGLPVRPVVSK